MRRLAPLLTIAIAAAACGGATGTETVVVATRTVVETATEVPAATATTASPALSSATFQLPSHNIGCTLGEGVLVCDVLSGLTPEPKRRCELDWTGIELESAGPAQPRCAGDTAYDQSAPVLGYGTSWARGGFTCASAETGLTCRNAAGRGFSLAREAWRLL